MEFKNNNVINNFITVSEAELIKSFINSIVDNSIVKNTHISHVASGLNGHSYMFDLTNTNVSTYLSEFQSSNNVSKKQLPQIFYDLMDRISNEFKISKEHVFMQILDMSSKGFVKPHYDSSMDGFINYKCNISILSENYNLYVGDDSLAIKELDLYGFEASLFKHWTSEFTKRRILLSYGFALRYSDLGRTENDPRVRLSKRIKKYFQ